MASYPAYSFKGGGLEKMKAVAANVQNNCVNSELASNAFSKVASTVESLFEAPVQTRRLARMFENRQHRQVVRNLDGEVEDEQIDPMPQRLRDVQALQGRITAW